MFGMNANHFEEQQNQGDVKTELCNAFRRNR